MGKAKNMFGAVCSFLFTAQFVNNKKLNCAAKIAKAIGLSFEKRERDQ